MHTKIISEMFSQGVLAKVQRIGRFETRPVVAKETPPGGHKVDGIFDLKEYLLNERREKFPDALVANMRSDALGRSLELNSGQRSRKSRTVLSKVSFACGSW